jgi:hypothetical protein
VAYHEETDIFAFRRQQIRGVDPIVHGAAPVVHPGIGPAAECTPRATTGMPVEDIDAPRANAALRAFDHCFAVGAAGTSTHHVRANPSDTRKFLPGGVAVLVP